MAVTHDITVEDVEYLRHGDTPLLARLFTPSGPGPSCGSLINTVRNFGMSITHGIL